MRILITGSAGYLGRGIVTALKDHHELKLFDVVPSQGPGEIIVGSVNDLDLLRTSLKGVDGIVIGHMAPRGKGYYQTPEIPFQVNVTGTANLYLAAAELGIRRVALISSTATVCSYQAQKVYLKRDLPYLTNNLAYGLTKICQELIAQQYDHNTQIRSAMLRPAYIIDADSMADKYGRVATDPNWQYIDPRDIGKAARLALESDDLKTEPFYVLGHPDCDQHADVQYTRDRLGWRADHDFMQKSAG